MFAIPIVWLSCFTFQHCHRILGKSLIVFWKKIRVKKNISGILKKNLKIQNIPKLVLIFVSIFVVLTPVKSVRGNISFYTKSDRLKHWDRRTESFNQAVASVSQYKTNTKWIYTDSVMIAIYNNLLIPPEVAVISEKHPFYRQEVLQSLIKYKPEQIVLSSSNKIGLLEDKDISFYIQAHYREVFKNGEYFHFVLKNTEILHGS
jgi:hypothetical protein